MPASNLNSGGDGLNTLSFLANIPIPLQDRYFVSRLDHKFSDNITFSGSYTFFRRIQFGIGDISVKDQVSVVQAPQRGTMLTGALTHTIRPNLINTTRFGFVRDVAPNQATSPTLAATLLNIPGTNTSAGPIALLIGSRWAGPLVTTYAAYVAINLLSWTVTNPDEIEHVGRRLSSATDPASLWWIGAAGFFGYCVVALATTALPAWLLIRRRA
jgi:hypothetical protein